MTETALILKPAEIIERIEAMRPVSIASHKVAIQRPLADLVEATVLAACKSAHTARYYRLAIGLFIKLLENERADVFGGLVLVDKMIVGKHSKTEFDYGATPAAVLLLVDAPLVDKFRRQAKTPHFNAAKTFLSVAYRDNVLTDDQARALGIKPYTSKVTRSQKPVGRRLKPLEVLTLRAAIDTSTTLGRRNLAMLDTMLYLGLRREEVANLRLSDFDQDQGRWAVTFTGKGDKARKLFVCQKLYGSLKAWLEVYGAALGDDAPLFTRMQKGDRIQPGGLTPQAVSDLVADYGHRAGLAPLKGKARLTPHDLRRTCARNAYDNGAALAAIQIFLGHADPKTTAHYIGLTFDEAASVTDFVNYG